ncbi:MAG: 7-carboxy-7-deazaguanine synthase QueE [Betaproteobacteria bacterium]|nr:7-carboxy-7-deazaguanine synthase QueE [Betaproteobacteria bacterium]
MRNEPDSGLAALKISEIFFSLQGEASRAGLPTVFIRLAGCPLHCHWCDTGYALTGGTRMTLAEIMVAVRIHPTRHVCVTGGEPLAQKDCLALLAMLSDANYEVCLETSGALPIHAVDARVSRIVDLKPPSSGEAEKNHWDNLFQLNARDELKFVIADRGDYEWASAVVKEKLASAEIPIWLSPAHNRQDARELAEWILADGLPVRLQMQLHKALWGNMRGR